MIRILIGTEPSQLIPQKVLEYSIRKNTSSPVEITYSTGIKHPLLATKFSFVRFDLPRLFNYQGKVIYLDADQLVLGDIQELWNSLDTKHDVAIVKKPIGTKRGKPLKAQNHTSVMVLNCKKLRDWDLEKLLMRVVPDNSPRNDNQISREDFMNISWMDDSRIQELNPRWNHMNHLDNDTRLIHFTGVRDQPWRNLKHPHQIIWQKALRECFESRFIKRREIVFAVLTMSLHPYYLLTAFMNSGRKL